MPRRIVLLPLILFFGTCLARSESHQWRINDPALAKTIIASGGKLIADYGAFQWIETEDTSLATADPSWVERADDSAQIKFNAAKLDTRSAPARALRQPAGSFAGKRLHLVHFAGPVKPEWRAELESNGVQIVDYVPENSFLVYGEAKGLSRLQGWAANTPLVNWDGAYADSYKIHPSARTGKATEFSIELMEDAEANAATLQLIAQFQRGPVLCDSRMLGHRHLVVDVPTNVLDTIAAQPDVISIQPHFRPHLLDERQDQIVAGNLTGNAPSGPGYLAWLASKGFTQAQFDASGFVVDVTDTGVDNGTTTPGHFGLYPGGNTALPSRVAYSKFQATPRPNTSTADIGGHGTIDAHIIAGYDNYTNAFPHTDSLGYFYGLGVCPFVKIGSSYVAGTTPGLLDFTDSQAILMFAYTNGARISNNSWGSSSDGSYDSDSRIYDLLVRDVGQAGLNRQMVLVFAAGNDGLYGASTIGSPGTAKNVITVGASENVRSMNAANGGNSVAGLSDGDSDNANQIAGFSSIGPCADGRQKPDLVAPGSTIVGGVPQRTPPPPISGLGLAATNFLANGIESLLWTYPNYDPTNIYLPGDPYFFFPLGQQFFSVCSGTSQATPAVAGACALLRQYFINQGSTPPSPALTKAYLMNSTRFLTAVTNGGSLWSPYQGMGGVNLGTAFDGAWRIVRDQFTFEKFTAAGQTCTYTGTVPDPTKPFRVTLAWTDFPGTLNAAKALVNDLDLTVTAGTNVYKGNVFNGQYSTNGGATDHLNNVESVFVPAGTATNFTVSITSANLVSDAITGSATSGTPQQDFALVLYNARVATPTLNSLTATGNLLTMQWNVPTNYFYRVQTKTNLLNTNWTDLTPDLLATNSLVTITNQPNGPQTFYRLRLAQ